MIGTLINVATVIVGSIIGLSLRILEIKQIRVLNMLPALVIILLLTWIKSLI